MDSTASHCNASRYVDNGKACIQNCIIASPCNRTCLITPAAEVGNASWSADIDRVLSTDIARGIVVADGILVQGGTSHATDDHVGSAINRDASDAGSALPENLCKVANIVEHIVGNTGLTEVRQHRLELALIPALSDAGSDVEVLTGDSEQILALTGASRNVMSEVAGVGGLSGSVGNSLVPDQWSSIVVGTSSVVMVKDGILVIRANRQSRLCGTSDVSGIEGCTAGSGCRGCTGRHWGIADGAANGRASGSSYSSRRGGGRNNWNRGGRNSWSRGGRNSWSRGQADLCGAGQTDHGRRRGTARRRSRRRSECGG
jgi:hypothetical protein